MLFIIIIFLSFYLLSCEPFINNVKIFYLFVLYKIARILKKQAFYFWADCIPIFLPVPCL